MHIPKKGTIWEAEWYSYLGLYSVVTYPTVANILHVVEDSIVVVITGRNRWGNTWSECKFDVVSENELLGYWGTNMNETFGKPDTTMSRGGWQTCSGISILRWVLPTISVEFWAMLGLLLVYHIVNALEISSVTRFDTTFVQWKALFLIGFNWNS